jgi:hypothetical protein
MMSLATHPHKVQVPFQYFLSGAGCSLVMLSDATDAADGKTLSTNTTRRGYEGQLQSSFHVRICYCYMLLMLLSLQTTDFTSLYMHHVLWNSSHRFFMA